MPFAAVEIWLRGFCRHVNNPALLVQRLTRPRHCSCRRLAGLGRPRVVTSFARTRDEIENPPLFPRPHVQCADGPLPAHATEDQRIFVDHSRRVQPRRKIHRSVLPKTADHLTRLRIECKEVSADAGEQPLFLTGVTLPIDEPPLTRSPFARALLRRIPRPQFLPRRRI